MLTAATAGKLQNGEVHTIANYVDEKHLADLRGNLASLIAEGAFVAGESFSSDGTSDTLRSALTWYGL